MTALWLAYMLFSISLIVVSFLRIRDAYYDRTKNTLFALLLTANSICVGLLVAEAI